MPAPLTSTHESLADQTTLPVSATLEERVGGYPGLFKYMHVMAFTCAVLGMVIGHVGPDDFARGVTSDQAKNTLITQTVVGFAILGALGISLDMVNGRSQGKLIKQGWSRRNIKWMIPVQVLGGGLFGGLLGLLICILFGFVAGFLLILPSGILPSGYPVVSGVIGGGVVGYVVGLLTYPDLWGWFIGSILELCNRTARSRSGLG
jgi:hypothetical protein